MDNKGKYVDSPEWVFEDKFNDAELTGTVLSFENGGSYVKYLTIKNRVGDIYRICYSLDKFADAFKVGGSYHFIGCTTVNDNPEKYKGSLRVDKLVDLSMPEKEKSELFGILERMLKVLGKKDEWERIVLPKYKRLPIAENTISDDDILMEFIDEFEGLWRSIESTIKQIGKDRGIYISPSVWSSELYEEILDYLNYISGILSNSFNSSAKNNYARYEFEKKYGETRRKGTKGIITNSLAYTLAFAVVCGINDTMDEIDREQRACSSWEQKQKILINGLNRTWQSLYDSKVIPMIKDANKECAQILKEYLFDYFECTEEEYNQWLETRIEKRKPTTNMIAELNELIAYNKKIIEGAGWFPFGQKAKERKKVEIEIQYLETEIKSVQKNCDLDGKEIWIYNVVFRSFEQYDTLTKNDKKFRLVFNNLNQVYEVRTTVKDSLIGYTDRLFVANYGRYRNLGAEACEVENLTALDTSVPNRFRMCLRIYDKD